MKLASLKKGRDGCLVVVSRDLKFAAKVPWIATTLQSALDDWKRKEGQLTAIYQKLNANELPEAFRFRPDNCSAPLPRAYQWIDGSAYVNHVELVRRARGAELPQSFWADPLMYQGGSDDFLGPREDIPAGEPAGGLDLEGEIAIVTDDVKIGVSAQDAAKHIKLLMLVNDVSLRGLIPGELGKGFGFLQSKPASSFSPVAVTPDELAESWSGSKVHLNLNVDVNGESFGKPNAGKDMVFSFADLIAHAARTRNLGSGTIVGSGTVSNKQGTEYGTSVEEGGVGYSCIAEMRMIETIRDDEPATPFLTGGDRVRIEMLDNNGNSIFGAIEQNIV